MSTHFTNSPKLSTGISFLSTVIIPCVLALFGSSAQAQVQNMVISQVYPGGGLQNAAFNRDDVVLFNPAGLPMVLSNWTLQYSAPTSAVWQSIGTINATIQPGRYFLVATGPVGTVGAALPTPNLVGSTAVDLGAAAGKVALVNNATLLSGACPASASIVDLLGYGITANCFEGAGPASAPNNNNFEIRRRNDGCRDTNNNNQDLRSRQAAPRNTATAPNYCSPVQLVVTNITPASPTAGNAFSVTVEARNAGGVAQGVLSNTTVALSTNGNAGVIFGSLTAVIPLGSSSVTFNNVFLSIAGTNVTITATRTEGQTGLQPGTSAPFTVIAGTITRVHFGVTGNTISEGAGTFSIPITISNPSNTQSTSVSVTLTGGDNARIGGFTSQMITFPAGSTAPQLIQLTVVADDECQGTEILSFGMQNVSGGQGPAQIGQLSTYTLALLDDDQIQTIQLARQYFAGSGSDNWMITGGAANVSATVGTGDTPPSQRILSAPASWQVNNQTATLNLGTIIPNQWSGMVIRARVASISTTANNGADLSDQVRFFVDVNGTGFPATPDITITGSTNARWGFSSGTAVASTTAGIPITVTPTEDGDVTDVGYSFVEIRLPEGVQSVALRIIANNNEAAEVWAIDNIEIIGNTCPQNWYSRSNGNIDQPIWSTFPGGAPGAALINKAANIFIQNGFTVANTTNTQVNDLNVNAGGTLVLTDNFALAAHGSTVALNGTVTTNQGTLALVGTEATSFSTASPLELYNLTVNTPGGTTLAGSLGIRGTLQLVQGNFNASSANVTLVSNSAGTGRLGEVTSGSYTGNLTVQRYIPGGATNWRLLGSPVAGATIDQWKNDFLTAGFPGSHYPEFFSPLNSGIYWPSIRWYDETVPSANVNDGVVGVGSNLTILQTGRGFAAWSGDNLTTTQPFVVDVTGSPNIAQTPIVLPMTYTNSGNPTVDGFNLVSNPLPSPIAFTQIQRGADVQNAYYLYDPATGNNLAWSNGLGIGAANGFIQSSQGFWLKATGPGVTTTVHESAKVNALQGGAFGGSEQPTVPMLRLTISSALNNYSDESLIVFDMGTPARDEDDVLKFVFAHPAAPQIATRSSDGHDLQIDFHGTYDADISIPVTVKVAVSGNYTLSAALLAMNGLSCVSLEDLSTGAITPLNDGATYTFAIDAEDDQDTPRFMLHATAPLNFHTTDILCGGDANGMATLELNGDPLTVIWMDASGSTIGAVNNASGAIILDDLAAGGYMVSVAGTSTACGTLVEDFIINAPFVLEVEVDEMMNASCEDSADGLLSVVPMGGVGPYEFLWSNGSTTEGIAGLPGPYSLTVTDANGCTWSSEGLVIGLSDSAPVAGFDLGGNEQEVNTPVEFFNTSVNADSYYWTFGDGGASEVAEPVHAYDLPGVYNVTLIAEGGECISIHSQEVTILLSTNISDEAPLPSYNVWVQDDHIIVEHNYNNGQPVLIKILDATGRLHIELQEAGTPGRVSVPANTLRTGVWFVHLINGGTQQAFRVPIVR